MEPDWNTMPTYYFDYREPDGLFADQVGYDLPDMEAARRLALSALGEATRDLTAEGRVGRLMLEVRDGVGPVLTLSASIEQFPRS